MGPLADPGVPISCFVYLFFILGMPMTAVPRVARRVVVQACRSSHMDWALRQCHCLCLLRVRIRTASVSTARGAVVLSAVTLVPAKGGVGAAVGGTLGWG